MTSNWEWDETLYEGSAQHYQTGRMAYPPELPERLAEALDLDGSQRLLDVGCGPGKLTIPLAPLFAEAVGLDADPGMIEVARASAPQLTWVHGRIEDARDLGTFDVVTFAQSFHWVDAAWARAHLRELVTPGGVVVHLGAMTHAGDQSTDELPHPRPPYDAIDELVRAHLGERRRAGRGTRTPRDDEDQVLADAGFAKEAVLDLEVGRVWERSEREVASAVLSLSYSTPALFGEGFPDFERDLRALLREASDDGRFSERQGYVTLTLWRARW